MRAWIRAVRSAGASTRSPPGSPGAPRPQGRRRVARAAHRARAHVARSCHTSARWFGASRSRPRWTWALTVPMGRSVMTQMSASDSSPKKRSVMTSRYGSGRAATDRRKPFASLGLEGVAGRVTGTRQCRHEDVVEGRRQGHPSSGRWRPGASSAASRCGPARHPVGRRRGSWPVSDGRARMSPAWRPRRPRSDPGSGSTSGRRWASRARRGCGMHPRPQP